MLGHILPAGLDITFNHDTLDQLADILGQAAVVQHFLDNAHLLSILFVGVGVVGVHNDSRIFQPHLVVHLHQPHDILIVVVGLVDAALVDTPTQDGVGQRVAGGLHLAAGIGVVLRMLRRIDRVEHDGKVSAGGVLHPGGHVEAAGRLPVMLVFHRPRSDRHIGQQVLHIPPILRIEHLIGCGKPVFLNGPHLQAADGYQTRHQVRPLLRIGLECYALVSVTVGAGFVGVNARNDLHSILDLLLHAGQAADIVADRLLVVRRAGPDDNQKLV